MPETLVDILSRYNHQTLTAMLNFRHLKAASTRKPDLVKVLADYYQDPKQIRETYTQLEKKPRALLDYLMRVGGEAGLVSIRQKLVGMNLVETTSSRMDRPDYHSPRSNKVEDLLAYLTVCGLVFGRPQTTGYAASVMMDFSPVGKYFIPEAVRAALPQPSAENAWVPPTAPEPLRRLESSARAFQRDLYLYWSYLNQNNAELTAKNLLAKRHLTALNATLLVKETIGTGEGESDFPRLMFLRALLEQLGLVAAESGFLRARPAAEFFALTPLERIRRCLEAYTNCKYINELTWHNKINTGGAYAGLLPAPQFLQDARRLILMYVKPEGWLEVHYVVDHIREQQYEFLFSRNIDAPNAYYYSYNHPYASGFNPLGWTFPEIYNESSGWEQVEANLIRSVIRRPLFWMGLVDLGVANEQEKEAGVFRLTAPGRWLLANGPAPEIPSEGGQVIVQPDYTITAFDPISDAVLQELEQFAQRISAERAIQFRLTQASVYAGQLRGWNVQRIQSTLEGFTGQPLPGNVVRTLQEWQGLHERIRITPSVAVIHAANPADLDAFADDTELSAWLSRRPAPEMALLPPAAKPSQVYSRLLKKGWLPLVTSGPEELPADTVELDASGLLTFKASSPNLYLRGFLARFADPDGPDAYRLTPASVRRAMIGGMDAPVIVSELEKVIAQPVPAALKNRLLAWSGHYGTATFETTILVSFKDANTTQELLKDPDLGALLHPLRPADAQVTVQVHAKDEERVKKLLAERGVEVK
jgi:hypothetical protein